MEINCHTIKAAAFSCYCWSGYFIIRIQQKCYWPATTIAILPNNQNGTANNSEEIIWCSPCHIWFTSPRSWLKLNKWVIPAVINLKDGCHVATPVTVIRCTEYGHHLLFMCPVITLHNQLMSPGYKFKIVGVIKLFRYVLAKSVSSASRRYAPATSIIWIRPQKVTHRSLMRDLLNTI